MNIEKFCVPAPAGLADKEMFLKMHYNQFEDREIAFRLDRMNFLLPVFAHEQAILRTLKDDPKWQAKVEPLLAWGEEVDLKNLTP